jgi:hypothetical protein
MVRVTAGAAGFGCTLNSQEMIGYIYSETLFVGGAWPSASNWYVIALASFLSPASQAEVVGAMLKHSGESIALNPEWARNQVRMINLATGVLLNTAEATRQATAAMNARQEKINRMSREETDNFNDVILGVTFTRDPVTGVEREVPTGGGGPKWSNGRGAVVDSALSPGPAFHPLQTISR